MQKNSPLWPLTPLKEESLLSNSVFMPGSFFGMSFNHPYLFPPQCIDEVLHIFLQKIVDRS